MDSPFPSPQPGQRPVEVSLDELKATWTGGRLWLQTALYEGASEVHAPYFEAPSIWESDRPPGLNYQERGTSRRYVAYVEDETVVEWAWVRIDEVDSVPLDWLWQAMPRFQLQLAFEYQSGRTIFSYDAGRFVEWRTPNEGSSGS